MCFIGTQDTIFNTAKWSKLASYSKYLIYVCDLYK